MQKRIESLAQTPTRPGADAAGHAPHPGASQHGNPWAALTALVFGFFMILVDSTIVSVANPSIMKALHTDMNMVIWATSAFLLAYVVPLLIAGRLGDKFGPRRLYLIGLVVFTLASLWCGLSPDIDSLIRARVVQGLGAALMTPQTMAVITRIFPPNKRGAALGIWGSVAGLATLVGPIVGGLLVDSLGWEWIFFVNVPVGVVGFILALKYVPVLERHPQRLDWVGVVLSAAGLFLIVFGLQEGETYHWGQIAGIITVWGLIVTGIVVLALFIVWEHFAPRVAHVDPLLPLGLFKDVNFSLANAAIVTVGFTIVSFALPLIFFYQVVRGMSPTQSALMMMPMAIISGVLAPFVGRLTNKVTTKYLACFGLLCMALGLLCYVLVLSPSRPVWALLLPSVLLGIANGFIWAPLSSSAVKNLPMRLAGAGSGVYNTTRQVGAVIGSASMAALMQACITAQFTQYMKDHAAELAKQGPHAGVQGGKGGSAEAMMSQAGALPDFLHAPFTHAMALSLLLPACVIACGAVVILFQRAGAPKQARGTGH